MHLQTDPMTTPTECEWDVDGLRLTGLAWGRSDDTPVLALHGWMDHAASFQELAPRLTGCRVVAIDLSGQGLSAHRAAHATYNIWDDLPQITELIDQIGWKDCVVVGHSRGANISALFAATQPEKVRAFVALDALVPEPAESETFVSTLRAFVEQTRQQKNRLAKTFATKLDYIGRRSAQGNSRQTSEALADRALEEIQDGFQMRGDARLFASSAVKLTKPQVETVLRSIQCPVLNIWAKDGIRQTRPKFNDLAQLGAELISQYEVMEVEGDHHFHLDPAIAELIAQAILGFLDRHRLR